VAVPVTFTFDLENHRRDGVVRYESVVEALLEDLEALQARGTFFVVADIARRSPGLVRRVADAGHEIATHDLVHIAWHSRGREQVRDDLRASCEILEDAVGLPVKGVRAPYFSLTRMTPWAPEVLDELGLTYSSSVLPARNPMAGLSTAPRRPFRWPGGVLELPVPLVELGPLALPVLGGVYLRYLPWAAVGRLIDRPRAQALWTYAHPYDLDTEEEFTRIHDAGYLTSRILWYGRKTMRPRLRRILSMGIPGEPIAERVAAGEFDDAPVWVGP
jgi:polysaccharide deacetylase family protein (PEP-CTERM system associated)